MLLFKIKAIILDCIFGKKIFTYRIFESDFQAKQEEQYYSPVDDNGFSIVIQGPWVNEDQFTLGTLLLYRKHFPSSIIIFSSTSDIDDSHKAILDEHNIHYIFNESPKSPGTSNVNFQIVTTSSGIIKARELGAKYVLKTRSDQRIHHYNLEDYLINLLDCFPVDEDSPKQRGRLIGCSLNTFKLRPYGVSDMFLFGYIDDMMNYWCVSLEERNNSDVSLDAGASWRDFAANEVCEVRFCTNYLRLIGKKVEFSIKASMEAMAKHFVIIDQNAIGLIWPKYSLDQNQNNQFGRFPEISFNDWLLFYMKSQELNFHESYLDKPITEKR